MSNYDRHYQTGLFNTCDARQDFCPDLKSVSKLRLSAYPSISDIGNGLAVFPQVTGINTVSKYPPEKPGNYPFDLLHSLYHSHCGYLLDSSVLDTTCIGIVNVMAPSSILAISSWLFSYYLVPGTNERSIKEIESV
jgi:hypothetical protein